MAPENTLPSFRQAVELGVRLLELDARLSRDGIVVCFHDARLDRVTPERGPVAERDWRELSEIPVMPGAFGGAYPDTRIPALADVLTELPDCRFLVELKTDGETADQLVPATLEVIRAAGAGDRSRIISFDQQALVIARRASPTLSLGVLANVRHAGSLLDRARDVSAIAIHAPAAAVDVDLARAAKEGRFLLNAWTVNTPQEVRRLAALGADEITTDYPAMARDALV